MWPAQKKELDWFAAPAEPIPPTGSPSAHSKEITMIYFSASTMGFYDTDIHASTAIPKDAKEITKATRDSMVKGQAKAILAADDNGYPILRDHP